MDQTALRLICALALCTVALGARQTGAADSDLGYGLATNSAGNLFAFMNNPVIAQAPAATPTDAGNSSPEAEAVPESPAPPSNATRNAEAEAQTVPLGDSAPPPATAASANPRNYRPRPVMYGVGSQALAAADQNFDLSLTNERLEQESEDLWERLSTAVSKLETYRVNAEREEVQYLQEEDGLRSSNANLEADNDDLQEEVDALESQYEDTLRRLAGYQENLTEAVNEAEALQTLSSELQSQVASAESEITRLEVIQGAAAPLSTPSPLFPLNLTAKNPYGFSPAPSNEITTGAYPKQLLRTAETTEPTSFVPPTDPNAVAMRVMRIDPNEEPSNDDNSDDLEASTDMVYVIGLSFMFLLLSTVRVWLGHHIDSYLTPTLYTLFVDVSILALLAIATGVINHLDWFDRDKINLKKIMYGMGVFIVFWFMLGLWLVLAAQAMARRWFKAENDCVDLRKVSHDYEEAYLQFTAEQGPQISYRSFSSTQSVMQFAVMRQEFICPTYLPYTTEMFLRNDFSLAEYLAKCFGDVIEKGMQLTGLGFAVLLLCAGVWRSIIYFGFRTEMTLFVLVPIISIMTCLIVIEKLRGIYFELVPYVYDPHEFHLPADNFSRNPMMNVDKVPIPPYLTGSLEHLQTEDDSFTCCGTAVNPLKLTCSYIFVGKYPNRHELLFWFDTYGPHFCLGLLQGVALILTFWMVVILIYYVPNLYDELEVWGIMAAIAALLIWAFNALYLLPEALRYLTLTSRIEQMKDRKKIDEVMLASRGRRSLKTVELYRQIKLIYREMSRDERKPEFQGDAEMPESMDRYVEEVFALSCNNETQVLEIPQLSDALELCGVKASNDELRVFIWETDAVSTTQENNQGITLPGFKRAMANLYVSARLRPNVVARAVLRRYFREMHGMGAPEEITLAELEQFFNDYGWHFTKEDVQEFLYEARYLLDEDSNLKITETADYLRDQVHGFPQ